MQKHFQTLFSFSLFSLFLLVSCGPVTPIPSATPTGTATLTPTATPKLTAESTLYPTQMPTQTVPTLIPVTPLPSVENYRLISWTPERAEALFRLMENYPETLSYIDRGYHDYSYYEAFYFAAQAGQEALLRFPDTPRGRSWRWWLGNDLMQSSWFADQGKPSNYFVGLVSTSLNSKEMTVDELPEWISANMPDVSATLIQLEPIKGFIGNYVLQVNSLVLWVLEAPTEFQVYPMMDDFYYFFRKIETKDMTGDGIPEVLILLARDANFIGSVSTISAFDLSQVPFRQLTFGSNQRNELRWGGWSGSMVQPGDNHAVIQIQNSYLVGCPIYRMEEYFWNGYWFDLEKSHFKFDSEDATGLTYCDQLYLGSSYLDAKPNEIIPLFEEIQPYWPAEDNYFVPEPDAQDELRFRLGVLYALTGDSKKAIEHLTDIIDNPTIPQSSWIAPAKRFLAKYETADDLYIACITTSLCNADFVIEQSVQEMGITDFSSAIEKLESLGIPIKSSTLLDFDRDASPEYWFTVRHPNRDEIGFWIIAQTSDGLIAHYVDTVTTYVPPIKMFTATNEVIFQIGPGKMFTYQTSPRGEPVIGEYTIPEQISPAVLIRQNFDQLREMFYAGENPLKVKDGLLSLQESPDFVCDLREESYLLDWQYPSYCPDFYYLLGLTYELSGDQGSAVRTYWQVWRDYPNSPFAHMVQFKLEPIP
jgi:hypothetical protein